MKALVLLKNTKCLLSNGCGIGFTVESLNEAIAELEELQEEVCDLREVNNILHHLMTTAEKRGANKATEELQNRSCESCKHGKYGIDSIGREVECKLLWRCSRGYSDKYERKEND